MNYDYFYGSQVKSYSFIRFPRLLMTGEEFRGLSTDAKMLYVMLLDRMGLSMRNGWLDEEGRVYIYYTLDEIQEDLNCGHDKAVKLLKELDTQNGIGLIERIKQGQGKPARIYVRQFSKNDAPDSPDGKQNELSLPKTRKPDSKKQDTIASEKQESWLREIRSIGCVKTDGNNIDKNYTENSYTDPSIYPSEAEVIIETVRERHDYPLLATSYMNNNPNYIPELISHMQCSTAPYLKLSSETIFMPKVQARFRRLRFAHAAYVQDVLDNTTSEIKNIKAYLLTSLYNAPMTIGPYYSVRVKYDASQ